MDKDLQLIFESMENSTFRQLLIVENLSSKEDDENNKKDIVNTINDNNISLKKIQESLYKTNDILESFFNYTKETTLETAEDIKRKEDLNKVEKSEEKEKEEEATGSVFKKLIDTISEELKSAKENVQGIGLGGILRNLALAALVPIAASLVEGFTTELTENGLEYLGIENEDIRNSLAEALGAAGFWGVIGRVFGRRVAAIFAVAGAASSLFSDTMSLLFEENENGMYEAFGQEFSPEVFDAIGGVIGAAIAVFLPRLLRRALPSILASVGVSSLLGGFFGRNGTPARTPGVRPIPPPVSPLTPPGATGTRTPPVSPTVPPGTAQPRTAPGSRFTNLLRGADGLFRKLPYIGTAISAGLGMTDEEYQEAGYGPLGRGFVGIGEGTAQFGDLGLDVLFGAANQINKLLGLDQVLGEATSPIDLSEGFRDFAIRMGPETQTREFREDAALLQEIMGRTDIGAIDSEDRNELLRIQMEARRRQYLAIPSDEIEFAADIEEQIQRYLSAEPLDPNGVSYEQLQDRVLRALEGDETALEDLTQFASDREEITADDFLRFSDRENYIENLLSGLSSLIPMDYLSQNPDAYEKWQSLVDSQMSQLRPTTITPYMNQVGPTVFSPNSGLIGAELDESQIVGGNAIRDFINDIAPPESANYRAQEFINTGSQRYESMIRQTNDSALDAMNAQRQLLMMAPNIMNATPVTNNNVTNTTIVNNISPQRSLDDPSLPF